MKIKFIPYGKHLITEKDISRVEGVLRSDWITQGKKIDEFEKEVAQYCRAKYAVAVSSGTAALHIACLTAGIEKGDEVISSPITFAASTNSVLYCGGKPVFADIESDTANIDIEEIKKKITKRTKAIIPVHFAGLPCEMEEIRRIAIKYGLAVIEDAAHALGAEYKRSKVGNCKYSDMTILSFHPVKSITTGEGGAVLTNNKKTYEKLVVLRNHGITKNRSKFVNRDSRSDGGWYYEMQFLGFNYRITDFQCSLGISQLKKLDIFIEKRKKISDEYKRRFGSNPYFDLPAEREYAGSARHLYPIRLKDKYMGLRKHIFDCLRKKDLGVQVHYLPVYFHPYYKKMGYESGDCPNAESFYKREISIPLYPSMKKVEVSYVVDSILRTFECMERKYKL